MKKLAVVLALALGLAAVPATAAEAGLIQWWPRVKPACMPRELRQFVTLEFMEGLEVSGEAEVRITLPENIDFESIVTCWVNPSKPRVSAAPEPEGSAFPDKVEQVGNEIVMHFPSGSFDHPEHTFLTFVVNVGEAPVGVHDAAVRITDEAGRSHTENIALEIRPKLSGTRSKAPLIVWSFQGLDAEFVPVYMNALTQAGANRFYEMREELPGRLSVVDFQDEFHTVHGTAFFGERVGKYFEDNGLPEELAGRDDIVFDNAWLLDHPEVLDLFWRDYFQFLTCGKPFKVVIYDAERGAFKANGKKIVGDLTPYALEVFGRRYDIPAEELTPENITENYKREWIQYCCEQSVRLAESANRAAKKYLPGSTFEVYSGYEYDFPPYADLTRTTYAVDWKSMKNSGMDAAGSGYFGSPAEIANTAKAVEGVCHLLPAEMYMEGFGSRGATMPRLNVENFAFRLISSYLAAGGHGIQLWYGAVMQGGALVALDFYTRFANLTSDFLADARRLDPAEIATVSPRQAQENTFFFRNGDELMAIALNPTDRPATLRVVMKGDYTTQTDLVSGEASAFGRITVFTLEPYSYRITVYR